MTTVYSVADALVLAAERARERHAAEVARARAEGYAEGYFAGQIGMRESAAALCQTRAALIYRTKAALPGMAETVLPDFTLAEHLNFGAECLEYTAGLTRALSISETTGRSVLAASQEG